MQSMLNLRVNIRMKNHVEFTSQKVLDTHKENASHIMYETQTSQTNQTKSVDKEEI